MTVSQPMPEAGSASPGNKGKLSPGGRWRAVFPRHLPTAKPGFSGSSRPLGIQPPGAAIASAERGKSLGRRPIYHVWREKLRALPRAHAHAQALPDGKMKERPASPGFRLGREQPFIEAKLARRHLQDGALLLYDVTSTYLEGHCANWRSMATAATTVVTGRRLSSA
jgi:hypothetical protein